MKKILIGLICLTLSTAGITAVQNAVWKNYVPPQVKGTQIPQEDYTVKEVTQKWFEDYEKQLKGWDVPYSHRIYDARIANIMSVLNLSLVDYEVVLASDNTEASSNPLLMDSNFHNIYKAQILLIWDLKDNVWTIKDVKTPKDYDETDNLLDFLE